jgi:hypothetical protein
VVDPDGQEGFLDAINRYASQAAVNYRGSSDALWSIPQLSTAGYCTTYEESARKVPLFPVFATDQYISPELHFTLKRPVK